MTEEKIFEILLPKTYDYPKLHSEAAEIIAKVFTDIIYDTLKVKSSLASSRRLDVLKFLKTLVSSSDSHFNVSDVNHSHLLEAVQHKFQGCNELDSFLAQASEQLAKKSSRSLCEEVVDFYKRRIERHHRKVKTLEVLKKYEQDVSHVSNLSSKNRGAVLYYETSEAVITSLLAKDSQMTAPLKVEILDEGIEYRTKQIKFAYALLHIHEWSALQNVLEAMTKYHKLYDFEINFLNYLNRCNEDVPSLKHFVEENFFFMYEQYFVKICTELIDIEENEVCVVFDRLICDPNFHKVKCQCVNKTFRQKVDHLLFQLYSYSYCHKNLLKFIKLFAVLINE